MNIMLAGADVARSVTGDGKGEQPGRNWCIAETKRWIIIGDLRGTQVK